MGIQDKNPQVQTISSSLGQRSQSQALVPLLTNQERQKLIAMLTALASHFWTPDFTPAQAAARFKDYTDDLADCTLVEIEVAIREYRLQPKIPGKFKPFPGSDDLRALVLADRKHRKEMDDLGPPIKNRESRPLRWWEQRRRFWKPHWTEDEIPAHERPTYDKLKAAGKLLA